MAKETGALAKDKMQKLARMELHGIDRKQTSLAMGVSESRISQIIETEEYKEQAEIIAGEAFQQNELINKGWDGIEALGIRRVVTALQNDPDPEFALKAATYANKASRRGGYANTPISQNAGVRAIVQLNTTFVEKLQQNFKIEKQDTSILAGQQKDSNFLGAKSVQDLLQRVVKEDADLLPSFGV